MQNTVIVFASYKRPLKPHYWRPSGKLAQMFAVVTPVKDILSIDKQSLASFLQKIYCIMQYTMLCSFVERSVP